MSHMSGTVQYRNFGRRFGLQSIRFRAAHYQFWSTAIVTGFIVICSGLPSATGLALTGCHGAPRSSRRKVQGGLLTVAVAVRLDRAIAERTGGASTSIGRTLSMDRPSPPLPNASLTSLHQHRVYGNTESDVSSRL